MKKNEILGAHFASSLEIEKEFFQDSGCILGKFNSSYLVDSSYRNILLLAPSGAGKGISFVIPNLLNWTESTVVYDIKLENFKLTSGYRQKILKQKVFVWNLNDKNGSSYNPLDYVLKNKNNIVENIKTLLTFLLPENNYIQMEAKNILTSIIIYLSKNSKNVSFGSVYRFIENKDFIANISNIDENKLDYFVENNIARFLRKSSEEQNKIIVVILDALDLWDDPIVDKATEKSDFDISSFNENLQTLYISVEPKDIEKFRPLFQMFYQQYLFENTKEIGKKVGTLLIMDEFITLSKMDCIVNLLPYTRGYKLKLCIIAQNIEQMKFVYGEDGTKQIISNSIKIAYNNGVNTANILSKMMGDEIIIDKDNIKITKPLVPAQEIVDCYKEFKEFIITQESKVIKCDRIKYYTEKEFDGRILEQIKINR